MATVRLFQALAAAGSARKPASPAVVKEPLSLRSKPLESMATVRLFQALAAAGSACKPASPAVVKKLFAQTA